MGNIFSTNNNETIILYPQNNAVYLLVANGITPCTPVILEENYKSNLSAFLYNQVLYYTYVNTNGEIVTKSTLENTTVQSLKTPEDVTPYKEALHVAEEKIISLEKAIENAQNQYAALMDIATKYREEAKKWYLIAKTKRQ